MHVHAAFPQPRGISTMEGNSLVPRPSIFARNYVFILAAVAALNNCNLGYDMGIVAGVGPILLKQNQFSVSEVQLELFIGVLDVSSLIGAASSNYLADKFGRRGCMALSELLFIFSVIGMACAQNYVTLVIFRCLCGVGVGLGLTIGPLYVGELAPSEVRGKLVSWSELATNIGLLTAFIVGAIAAGLPEGVSWRLMLGLGAVLPTVLLCSLFCMPESPRWLILHGKVEVARGVLQRIHPPGADTDALVLDIQQTLSEEAATYVHSGWHAIFHPTRAVYCALLAGVGIAAIQQLSGIEALTSYFVFIFQRAGLKASDAFMFLILFGVCKLATVYIASRYFDDPNCGRRKLLLTSGVGVFVSMFVFAWVFSFPISPASQAIAVVTMFWYVIAYSVGYGPGAWVVMLEVLPMQIRAKGLSLCTFVNRCIATLLSGSFLTLVRYMRYCGYFWLFAVVTLACVVYVFLLIPETQGHSLEGMSAVFESTARKAALQLTRRKSTDKDTASARAHRGNHHHRHHQQQDEELKDAKVDTECAAGADGVHGLHGGEVVRNPLQPPSHGRGHRRGREYSSVQRAEAAAAEGSESHQQPQRQGHEHPRCEGEDKIGRCACQVAPCSANGSPHALSLANLRPKI